MDKFDSYLKYPDIIGIIYKVLSKYRNSIDVDELDSIKMLTLWNCIKKYNPDKGVKFTSYLYSYLTYACKNELKKKRREYGCDRLEAVDNRNNWRDLGDIVDGLPPEIAKVLNQRFVHSMTMHEIGCANGYSRETARRRLINAIQVCRKRTCIKT